jgi:hypothetical protein
MALDHPLAAIEHKLQVHTYLLWVLTTLSLISGHSWQRLKPLVARFPIRRN